MKAEQARQYSAQVLNDFADGLSAKKISKKYCMHERHVAMILREAGINAKDEYQKRVMDGTYNQTRAHHDSWYINRFGKSKEELEECREKQRQERKEKREQARRNAEIKSLICVLKKKAAQDLKQQKKKEKYQPIKTICKHCGKEWTFYPSGDRYGRKHPPVYCSEKCRRIHNRHGKGVGHRLRMYGRGSEPRDVIKLKALAEKEDGICYICGQKIDWTDYRIDDKGNFICGSKYPTIDHVKPLSKGGTHTWNNVKLAHHLCNCLKATKEIA